ncbi:carnitine O-palmitoyltransferase 2, mitochondrial isoform X1 [Nasonia vitripennis]|uniref:Choline/carnitine acyltransferase domain-containing protein n=2 Tax=Nasonia vitripennis TaxID=7425 RepID=A0A7M7LSA6_NASVI|nr:carnitine O-palmitoyltransferase 2, mitochondrial isoform X1 [Nasonia vitripennis]
MSLLAARRFYLSRKTISNESAFTYFCCTKTTIATDHDLEYIQRSKVPTMHFQPSLPRLPIPKLEDTCRRYLNAQRPLLHDEQMQKTQAIVDKFLKGEGAELHAELVRSDAAKQHTSYISEPWFDMYLRDRRPLPINYNPFLVFSPEDNEQYNSQLVKATNLTVSSLRFLKSLRANLLEPEVFHLNPKKSDTKFFRTFTGLLPSSISWYGAYLMNAYPLDMSQYSNLFNSTRIPHQSKDEIVLDKSAKHIVVMRKGRFYAFNVFNEQGNIVPPKEIATNLRHILDDQRPDNENPVGILTASERNNWASIRSHLTEIGNGEILRKIDSAAFVLILDDEPIGTDENKLLRRYLHGGAENRWFDKSFSLIVSKDGFAGINFEHSWGDGVAVLRYFQDIKKDISEKPRFHPEDERSISGESSLVQRLDFKVDDKAKDVISKERTQYEKWTKSLDIGFMVYEGFGKRECKDFGVSPDAVMQLVFQLALFKQESKSVAAYESCSTAAFKHGRTETLRPCTVQTKNLCSTMTSSKSDLSIQQIKKMIIDCSNAHLTLLKEAAMGQGFDRHLFALRKLAEKSGKNPEIFQDPGYAMINHNILSTSTLSSPVVIAGGFGPVVDDGYGIGYMIQEKKLGVVVTSYRNHRSAKEYVNSLEASFKDIHKVLLSK